MNDTKNEEEPLSLKELTKQIEHAVMEELGEESFRLLFQMRQGLPFGAEGIPLLEHVMKEHLLLYGNCYIHIFDTTKGHKFKLIHPQKVMILGE